MGDRLCCPGQLNLAIPSWVGSVVAYRLWDESLVWLIWVVV